MADLNWRSFNNFRSGELVANDGLVIPDVTLAEAGVCELDCDEGLLRAYVHVGNEGLSELPGATVRLSAIIDGVSRDLGEIAVSGPISSGWYLDGFEIEVPVEDGEIVDEIRIEVEIDGTDCDPADNMLVVAGPFCAG